MSSAVPRPKPAASREVPQRPADELRRVVMHGLAKALVAQWQKVGNGSADPDELIELSTERGQ